MSAAERRTRSAASAPSRSAPPVLEYAALREELQRLRSEFDQTLAGLQRGEGLGKVLGQPIRRGRKVTLGRPL